MVIRTKRHTTPVRENHDIKRVTVNMGRKIDMLIQIKRF